MTPPDVAPGTQPSDAGRLNHRHLLGLEDYSASEIRLILETARAFRGVIERPIKKVPSLRGVTCVNLFYESSTRTRLSFELAEKRLSADVVNFSASGSSVSKGETLRDTARNIEAMKIDLVVVRHRSAGAPHFLTRCVDAVIVNAGDGQHEHPTQALLDASSIARLDIPSLPNLAAFDFRGLRVAIIGDIAHSRVARSNVYALAALGAEVTLCGPRTMMPVGIERLGARVTDRLDEALEGCDVAMALRIQLERQGAGPNGLFPSLREYHDRFGLRGEHLERNPDLYVMHPGPVNWGVELAGEVAESDRAVILDQVTNGVAVRMAVLYLLAGGTAARMQEAAGG
ncbi:MAG TPA: aspartate carbamoyltransferase catalytic subunit [Bacteroidetes bacterium]|nr:aspartate carbamoyltransferase catalytic subunit [Bacteroidota bacterium]